jgi:hypothetical protein
MKLTDSIVLQYSDGYYEVQHVKVAEESGKEYLTAKKTFATIPHLQKYLSPYNIAEEVLQEGIIESKKQEAILNAKMREVAKRKFNKDVA